MTVHLGDGFDPGHASLPPARFDLPWDRRERAAEIIHGIGQMATPEEIARGEMGRGPLEPLELEEALTHLDLLLDVLLPPDGQR